MAPLAIDLDRKPLTARACVFFNLAKSKQWEFKLPRDFGNLKVELQRIRLLAVSCSLLAVFSPAMAERRGETSSS